MASSDLSIYNTPMQQTLSRIIGLLITMDPHSREEMILELKKILGGSIVKILDSHNTKSIIMVFSIGNRRCLIKSEFCTNNSVRNEIKWYRSVPKNSLFLPNIISCGTSQLFSYILMDYLENSSTLDGIIANTEISDRDLLRYVDIALSTDLDLFSNNKSTMVKQDSINNFLLSKYQKRSQESARFPYLKKLLASATFEVNDKIYHNPDYYFTKIYNDRKLRDYLTPRRIGLIHGDLHFGNILVHSSKVALVDPGGENLLPIEYDYGKILHSIHGQYGVIMNQDYKLAQIAATQYSFTTTRIQPHEAVLRNLKERFSDKQFLSSMYFEALHFATMLPHHAKKETETTVLFLRCIQIFQELLEYVEGNDFT